MPAKPFGVNERHTEIAIGLDGSVVVEMHGFSHGACQLASPGLEQALGTVVKRQPKDDDGGAENSQTVG